MKKLIFLFACFTTIFSSVYAVEIESAKKFADECIEGKFGTGKKLGDILEKIDFSNDKVESLLCDRFRLILHTRSKDFNKSSREVKDVLRTDIKASLALINVELNHRFQSKVYKGLVEKEVFSENEYLHYYFKDQKK